MKLNLKRKNTWVMFNIIFVLLIAMPVSGAGWVEYRTDQQGNIFSYDRDSIKNKTAEIVQVRERMDSLGKVGDFGWSVGQGRTHSPENKKFACIMSLIEIHCMQAKYQVVEFRDFDTEGNLISTGSFENDWIHISPETFADELRKRICQ